jgi:hypothetical protein
MTHITAIGANLQDYFFFEVTGGEIPYWINILRIKRFYRGRVNKKQRKRETRFSNACILQNKSECTIKKSSISREG